MYTQYERGTCAECSKFDVLIVHKKRRACSRCVAKKNVKTFIKMSRKSKEKRNKVNRAYKKLDSTVDKICTGCGRSDVPLSRSHLVPRSANKFLADNLSNLTYHCTDYYDAVLNKTVEGCHSKWESHNPEKMKQLLDFEKNLDAILKLDERYYVKLCSKIISR